MSKQSPNHKENKKRYMQKHKDRLTEEGRVRYRTPERYVYHMLKRAERRASLKGVPFSLTKDDITIPDLCPMLGIKLEVSDGKGASESSPALDRIVPEIGYVRGNVRVISTKANRIKSNATIDEIECVLSFLKEHQSLNIRNGPLL